jgi:hypothetical protein
MKVLYLIISEPAYTGKEVGLTSPLIPSAVKGPRSATNGNSTGSFDFESFLVSRCRRGSERVHVYPPPTAIKPNRAVQQCKNCVVAAQADVFPGQKFCPSLTDNDVAGHNHFAAEFFDTEPLADAVAAILNAALSFFVSHWRSLMVEV